MKRNLTLKDVALNLYGIAKMHFDSIENLEAWYNNTCRKHFHPVMVGQIIDKGAIVHHVTRIDVESDGFYSYEAKELDNKGNVIDEETLHFLSLNNVNKLIGVDVGRTYRSIHHIADKAMDYDYYLDEIIAKAVAVKCKTLLQEKELDPSNLKEKTRCPVINRDCPKFKPEGIDVKLDGKALVVCLSGPSTESGGYVRMHLDASRIYLSVSEFNDIMQNFIKLLKGKYGKEV